MSAPRLMPLTRAEQIARIVPIKDVVRSHILMTLAQCEGNKTLAADALGINRKTLYRKLEAYDREAKEE